MNRLDPKLHLEKKIQSLLAFYATGNFEEVILKTKPLIKKYPNIIDLYNLLALSYNGYGNPEKGIFILNEAKKVQPKNIHVLNNLGLIYSSTNNFKLANEHLTEALNIKPDFFQAINIPVEIATVMKWDKKDVFCENCNLQLDVEKEFEQPKRVELKVRIDCSDMDPGMDSWYDEHGRGYD